MSESSGRVVASSGRTHGLAFDAAVFVGNVLSFAVIHQAGENLSDGTVGVLLCVAILTQLGGAWLKGRSLRARLGGMVEGWAGWAEPAAKILLLLHFILFTVIALMAVLLLGLYHAEAGGDLWAASAMVTGGLATYTVWRAARSGEPAERGWADSRWQEFAADGLLWVSTIIVTRFFWDMLVGTIEPARGVGFTGRGVVLLVAMSLLFVVFYLPSRYLFLVEDFRSPWTWLQVWIAMLPVAWLIVVG